MMGLGWTTIGRGTIIHGCSDLLAKTPLVSWVEM